MLVITCMPFNQGHACFLVANACLIIAVFNDHQDVKKIIRDRVTEGLGEGTSTPSVLH